MSGNPILQIRHLYDYDINALLALEKIAWPEDTQASEVQLKNRILTFKEGFFGTFLSSGLVGTASSQIIEYQTIQQFKSWDVLTAGGWISKTHYQEGNCLHFVSICVHPEYRNQGIGTQLNLARLNLAKELNLKYALTDTRLPGLSAFLKQNRNHKPDDYLDAIQCGEISEPVVQMYLSLGFQPIGLIPECMKSDIESANYGLAMLKEI